MLLAKLVGFASVSALLAFGVGCSAAAGEEGDSAQSAIASPESEGTFQLYENGAQQQADSRCDVHTELTLAHYRTDGELRAELHEVVRGICSLRLIPDPRTYNLDLASESCGSKVFTGTTVVDDQKRIIKITDNRNRTCRDMVAAEIIVEETRGTDVRVLHAE